jgi:hypothetical protein
MTKRQAIDREPREAQKRPWQPPTITRIDVVDTTLSPKVHKGLDADLHSS